MISHLAGFGILAVFHYLPLHLSPMARVLVDAREIFQSPKSLFDRLLRLPFFTGMSSSEQSQVIETVQAFRC